MNKFFGALLAVLFTLSMIGTAAAERKGDWRPDGAKSSSSHQRISMADNNLRQGGHVLPFVPHDLKGKDGEGIYCDDQGNEMSVKVRKPGYGICFEYYSNSEKTTWLINYGGGTRVYKVGENGPTLWATFGTKNAHVATYASPEAQKYASARGTSNTDVAQSRPGKDSTEVAQSPQPAKENCGGKGFLEKAACELRNAGIERAVGAIIK